MAIDIAIHSGSTSLSIAHVDATVHLQETDVGSGQFQCLVQYKYSAFFSGGSGAETLPVSGNLNQQKQLPHDIALDVRIENWTLTSTGISFNLTASLTGLGDGPKKLFDGTPFCGPLPTTVMPHVAAVIAAHVAAANG